MSTCYCRRRTNLFRILASALVVFGAFGERVIAQTSYGYIRVFGDAQMNSCAASDLSPGVLTFYIHHMFGDQVFGSRFRLVPGGGFSGTYLSEASAFTTMGGLNRTGFSGGSVS